MADDLADVKPYPGLRSFRREEYGIFFGRDDCLDQMIKSLENDRFLAVIGPSGNGKSSLVRAAFFHELSFGLAMEAGSLWQFADIAHPARTTPFDQLARALLTSRPGSQRGSDLDKDAVSDLASTLEKDPFALLDWTKDEENLAAGHNLLILVDQFEELYTYDTGENVQVGFNRGHVARFIRLLLDMIEREDCKHIYIVITMRAEHLNLCTTFPGLAERFSADAVIPPRMTRDQWRAAIAGPANYLIRIGSPNAFIIHEDLIDVLLNDLSEQVPFDSSTTTAERMELLGRQSDQLPLLQHVLNGLWKEAYKNRHNTGGETILTRENYRLLTQKVDTHQTQENLKAPEYGLNHTLNRRGHDLLKGLSEDQKLLTQRIFRSLIDGPSISRAFRRPCTIGQLAKEAAVGSTGTDEPTPELIEKVREIVDIFRDDDVCFLTPIKVPGQNQPIAVDEKISISHESLIRQWRDLREWYEIETRDRQQWKQIVSLLGRDDESEGFVERLLHAWDKWRNRTTGRLLWRSVTLRDIDVWWKGLPAVKAKPGWLGYFAVKERKEVKGAFPFPGWIDRYFPDKGIAQFEAATTVYKASLSTRQRSKTASYLLSTGALALAVGSTVFASYNFYQGETYRTKAENAQSQAQNAQRQAEYAQRQAENAQRQAENAQRAVETAQRDVRVAKQQAEMIKAISERSRIEAKQAIDLAAQIEKNAKDATETANTAVGSLVATRMTEFDNYTNGSTSKVVPDSYEAYQDISIKVKQLGSLKAQLTYVEKLRIANATLTGALHATSQLDRKFLEDAITDADSILANLNNVKENAPILYARLMLAKGRLAIWDGAADDLTAALKYYGDAKSAAGAANGGERIVALANAGLVEATRMAGLPKIALENLTCQRPKDQTGEESEAYIAEQAAWVRCIRARIESAETVESAQEQLNPIQSFRPIKPRVLREITAVYSALGDRILHDRLNKKMSISTIKSNELDLTTIYLRASSVTASWRNHIVKNSDTVSGYSFDFQTDYTPNDDSPIPAPFQGYSFVDIYGYLRARTKFILTLAETESLKNSRELDPEDFSSSALRLGAIGSLVTAQTFSGRPDIFGIKGEGKRLVDSMLDGASLAPIIAGLTPESKMSKLAELTRMSVSMAADSSDLIEKFPDKDRETAEAAKARLNQSISSLAKMFDQKNYYTSFLNYAGDSAAALVVDPRAVTTLEIATMRICVSLGGDENCVLAKSFDRVKANYDAELKKINLLAQEDQPQTENGIWTDKNRIALGGIDVTACLNEAEPVSEDEGDALAFADEQKLAKPAKKGAISVDKCDLKIGNLAFAKRVNVGGRLFGSASATFLFASEYPSDAPFKLPELNGLFVDDLADPAATKQIMKPQVVEGGYVDARGWIIGGKLYFTRTNNPPDQAMIAAAEIKLRDLISASDPQSKRQKK